MKNRINAFIDEEGSLRVNPHEFAPPLIDPWKNDFLRNSVKDLLGNRFLVISNSSKQEDDISVSNTTAIVLDRAGTLHVIKDREKISLGQHRFAYDLYGLDPKRVETNTMNKKDEVLFNDHEKGVLHTLELISDPKKIQNHIMDVIAGALDPVIDFSMSSNKSFHFANTFIKKADAYDMENGLSSLMREVWSVEAPQHKNYDAVKNIVGGFISDDMINELVCTGKLNVKTAVPYRRPNDVDKGPIPMIPLFCKLYIVENSDGAVVTVSPYGINKGMKRLSDYISPDGVFNKLKMDRDFQRMYPDKHPRIVNEKTEKTNQKGIK